MNSVLAEYLEVANNFRVYFPQFGDPISKISNQNFKNCWNTRDILKRAFSYFKRFLLVVETKSKKPLN